MSASEPRRRLELEVSDFGPIVGAKLDLRPFTLFVGPSNTGKSYMAILIYALHRLFFGGAIGTAPSGRRVLHPQLPNILRRTQWSKQISDLPDDSVKLLLDWALQGFGGWRKADATSAFPDVLPDEIASLLRPVLAASMEWTGSASAEMNRCFGVRSSQQLVRSAGTAGARVVMRWYVGAAENRGVPFKHSFEVPRHGEARLVASVPEEQPLRCHDVPPWMWRYGAEPPLERATNDKQGLLYELVSDLAEAVFPYIAGPVCSPAYYLPAGRTGVMHAHRVVLGALVERAAGAAAFSASPMSTLSGVLADFLTQLISVDVGPTAPEGGLEELAARLEDTVLGGTVRQEAGSAREGSLPSLSYRPEGSKETLPLMRTSSMVSELAPVVLYLRHVVTPGDLLVIEEPESHLHPAMQVEFTRLLAAAVRKGVRVIVTTHSQCILEELANLVGISMLPEAKRTGIGGADVALEPHEVGAWLFQPRKRPRGSVVQEISLDPDSGTFDAGYDDVAAALYNGWAEITSRRTAGK